MMKKLLSIALLLTPLLGLAQTYPSPTFANPTFTGTVTGVTKAAVGLGNVDNTSDSTKNAATATLTNKSISGADNTLSNIPQSAITSLTTDLAGKVPVARSITINGTAYDLSADRSWSIGDVAGPSSAVDSELVLFSGTSGKLVKRASGDGDVQVASGVVTITPGWAAEATVASASTTSIGSASSRFVQVTGTTTITSFGTNTAGTLRMVRFAGSLTVTHNATSLISPTGASISAAAGDVLILQGLGSSNWRILAWLDASLASDLAAKAPLASPALTGTPTAPTASGGTNTTQIATTAFVTSAVSGKANTASPTFTGTPAAPTASAGTNTTQLATTAFTGTAITNERTASRTLTNVTLTAPAISAPAITGGGTLVSPTYSTSTPGIGWQVDSYLGRTTDGVGLVLGSKSTAYNYSTANINGGGHIVGAWSGAYNNSSGKTIGMAIGGEQTLGNQAGTITRAISSFNTINESASGATMTDWVGSQSEPTNNAGTITAATGFRATLPGTDTNTGTIGGWTAFQIPDASSSGVSSRVAFDNQDPGAVVKSKTPFADSSVYLAPTLTDGGSTTIPANYGTVVLNSGGTVGSHTLVLPSTPPDGQTITFFSVIAITSLTITSSGNTMIGMPASVAAEGFFTLKFTSLGPYWIRIG